MINYLNGVFRVGPRYRKQVTGVCFWRVDPVFNSISISIASICPSLTLMLSLLPGWHGQFFSSHALPMMSLPWNQQTMVRNLWNCETKQTFPPFLCCTCQAFCSNNNSWLTHSLRVNQCCRDLDLGLPSSRTMVTKFVLSKRSFCGSLLPES